MTTFCLDARTVTDHFPGISRYVASLAAAMVPLLRPQEALRILTPPAASSGSHLGALVQAVDRGAGARTTLRAIPVSPFGLAQQWRVPPALRGVAAYHSPYYHMPYRPGAPTVLTVYDLIPRLLPGMVSARARLSFRPFMWLAIRSAARLICSSERTRRDLLAHYPVAPERAIVIPLAPAPQFRRGGEAEAAAARARYGLGEEFVLYLGVNKPHKNLVRLVDAWARVQTDHVLVIGGAWDARWPEARVRSTELGLDGRVRFIGRVAEEDLPGLYSACTVFVFPSLYEGFGLPVVEAMACGAAVACSKASSLPEVGGEAVVYFDPVDTAQMAGVLSDLLAREELRTRLGAEARARASRFSWARTAAATLEIYRSVATSRAR